MDNIVIKEYTTVIMTEILLLYESVGWRNYTENPAMLEEAYENSLKILAAWENDKLVGIIRAVGDGSSILYIQDIIVLPDYQKQGIGKRLIIALREIYPDIYQTVLITLNEPKTVKFYESCGFSLSSEHNCIAFIISSL